MGAFEKAWSILKAHPYKGGSARCKSCGNYFGYPSLDLQLQAPDTYNQSKENASSIMQTGMCQACFEKDHAQQTAGEETEWPLNDFGQYKEGPLSFYQR